MLRSMEHLIGLPELRFESERWNIDNGNDALKFCSKVCHWCLDSLVPFAFESPWTSLLWETTQMQHLKRCRGARFARTDFSEFGLLWRKATGFLCAFANVSLIERKCEGCHGLCSKSGKPHQHLAGIDLVSGTFWTQVAEPYPRGLCTALIKMSSQACQQLPQNEFATLLEFAAPLRSAADK